MSKRDLDLEIEGRLHFLEVVRFHAGIDPRNKTEIAIRFTMKLPTAENTEEVARRCIEEAILESGLWYSKEELDGAFQAYKETVKGIPVFSIGEKKDSYIRALHNASVLRYASDEPFTLRSGLKSHFFLNMRRLTLCPDQWETIIQGMVSIIKYNNIEFDMITGVPQGGMSHAAAIAFNLKMPFTDTLKGGVSGARVLVVEDVVTTGDSAINVVKILRRNGAIVEDVVSICERGYNEHAFADNGITLITLCDKDDFVSLIGMEEEYETSD